MEHVVFYPSLDGSPAFRRVASLEEAARFVEHLRNVEDVTDFSVHALTAVPLSVRPWYRVEMPFDAQGPAEPMEPYGVAPAVPEPAEAPFATLPLAAVPSPEASPAEPAAVVEEFAPVASVAAVAPVEEFAPVAPVAPVEQLEPMAPELAEAVAGGRRSMGFFTR
jgi:hypothetical protein